MKLANFIEQHSDAIIRDAVIFAETQAPAGVVLEQKELRNHLPQILKAIVSDLRTSQSDGEELIKAEGRAERKSGPESAAAYHGRTRAIAGFGVNQMVAEYRALRASVLRQWISNSSPTTVTESFKDLVRFNEAIDQAVAESLAEFTAEVESWRQIFLSSLGHDLRGPLSAVVLSADMLAEEVGNTPLARHADRVLSGALRMSKLLDELLIYSRSKLGSRMVIETQYCDIAQEIADEVDLLRAALPTATIRYDTRGDARGNFDPSRVREALHNLATNAAKYGDVAAGMSILLEGQPGDVVISVHNSGEPLSGDAIRTIFEPLRRGRTAASQDEHTSLGLGLFLVREIALAHGGSVEVNSIGRETTFSITLPRTSP